MTSLRPVLWLTLLLLGFMLWSAWQEDNRPQPEPLTATQPAGTSAADMESDLPDTDALQQAPVEPAEDLPELQADTQAPEAGPAMAGSGPSIRVITDVLDLDVSLIGGTVTNARLLNYPVTTEEGSPRVQLLSDAPGETYLAQSGLLSKTSTAPDHTQRYQSERNEYRLAEGAQALVVPLVWEQDGIRVTKTLTLQPGSYVIDVQHQVENTSGQPWRGAQYQQLQRTAPSEDDTPSFTDPGRYSYVGASVYSPSEKYEKVEFDDMADEPFARTFEGGWLAMVQHYFFSAWIPPAEQQASYSSQVLSGVPRRYLIRAVLPVIEVAPGQTHTYASQMFVGPKLQDQLDDISEGLSLTVDYGIFTILSRPLFWLLSWLHDFLQNWGFAIIALVVLIKLAFFKLTETQYKSMARMRQLQPKVEALKERYGDDRQKMSQAMMELYKREKVNPLGGCLPMLIQIPIFISLYWVLLESVELRQAPFVLWIQDLSEPDPYFVLPALNAVFMIATQRLTPMTAMDPMQRKMMNALPIVFSILFAFFPAGLVLYWATNAGLSLLQQWYITRKLDMQPKN